MLVQTASKYKNLLPEIIHDDGAISGFKHPVSNQVFLLTSDLYGRKQKREELYTTKGLKTLNLKISPGFRLAKLIWEYIDIAAWGNLMTDLSEEQHELFTKQRSNGYICRHDDGRWLRLQTSQAHQI